MAVREETVRLVVDAVAKYPVPDAVKAVVLAPPDIVNNPEVIVEEALERKPAVKVVRPVCVRVPPTVSDPTLAVCENRLVEEAVVEKKLVVVPAVRERFPRVVRPVTPSVEESVAAPDAESVPTAAV